MYITFSNLKQTKICIKNYFQITNFSSKIKYILLFIIPITINMYTEEQESNNMLLSLLQIN